MQLRKSRKPVLPKASSTHGATGQYACPQRRSQHQVQRCQSAGPDDGTTSSKLLAWLDPDSTAVAYLRRDRTLDGEQLATIFGLPPNLEDLVKAPSDLAWALGVRVDLNDSKNEQ